MCKKTEAGKEEDRESEVSDTLHSSVWKTEKLSSGWKEVGKKKLGVYGTFDAAD